MKKLVTVHFSLGRHVEYKYDFIYRGKATTDKGYWKAFENLGLYHKDTFKDLIFIRAESIICE